MTYITGVTDGDKVKDIEPDIDGFLYVSGTRSVYLACELGAKEVYIIGHDLYSLDNNINNVYAGTKGYADKYSMAFSPDNSDETLNWILQHKNTFNKIKDDNNPGKTPNSLIMKPDNQAPISLYKLVGRVSETIPQPVSRGLKVIKIETSDI